MRVPTQISFLMAYAHFCSGPQKSKLSRFPITFNQRQDEKRWGFHGVGGEVYVPPLTVWWLMMNGFVWSPDEESFLLLIVCLCLNSNHHSVLVHLYSKYQIQDFALITVCNLYKHNIIMIIYWKPSECHGAKTWNCSVSHHVIHRYQFIWFGLIIVCKCQLPYIWHTDVFHSIILFVNIQ